MNIREKFETAKYWYDWGAIYNPQTGEKLHFNADKVYCKSAEALIMTYQKSEEDIPKIIRIVFVD